MEDLKFSHSQLWQWDACQARWHFSYVAGYSPIDKPEPLRLGSLVHQLLADYYEGVIENEPDPQGRLKNLIQVKTTADGAADDISLISRAYKLVSDYIEYYAPVVDHEFRPVEVEKHFEMELVTPKGREIVFQMYLDLLFEHIPTGKYWLVDHKTHSARPWSMNAILMDPQLPTYAAILRDHGVDVFGMMFNFLNVYHYKTQQPPEKFFKREKTYRTPSELQTIRTEQLMAIDEIIDNYNDPRRSLSKDCERCPFQDPCLMLMKGHTESEAFDLSVYKKGEVSEFYQD